MPFLKLFDVLPGWVWACVVAGLAVILGGYQLTLWSEENAHNATKTEYTQYQTAVWKAAARRAESAQLAEANRRDLERLRNRAATLEMETTHAEQTSVASALVASRTLNDELHGVLASLAARSPSSGAGDGNPAALQRAEERTVAIGSLLETCRREATQDAGELEGLATQVRGLILRYDSLLKTQDSSPGDRPQTLPGKLDKSEPASALPLRSTTGLAAPAATGG